MKKILFATATTLLLASSASAGSIMFTLPSVTFPPADDTTVSKTCITVDATTQDCAAQE